MIIHEHLDVIQWGHQLFDGDPIGSGYYGDMIHHGADDVYDEIYQDQYDTDCSRLENDEVIARTLQEEFLQLAVSGASRYSCAGEEHYQASNLGHDRHSPSMNFYSLGIGLSCFMDMLGSHQLSCFSYPEILVTMCRP